MFVLLLIAGGAATPLHRLVSSLPILSSSRFPIKYVIVASPLIIALVVLGLEATREDPRWALGATALLCAVLALGLWTVSLPEWREFLAAGLADYRDTRRVAGIDHADFPAVALEAMRARVVHALLFALALGAALTAGLGASSSSGTGAGKRPGRERAILFVVVLVGLDLATAARFSVVGASLPPSRDPFTDATRSDRDLVYHRGPNPALPPMAHRPGSSYFADEVRSGHARGVLPIHGRRRLSTTDANALDQAAHDEARRLLSGFAGLERDQVFALLGRAGVRWLSSPAVEPLERVATQRIEGEADQHLYLLPRTRPYVSSFGDWRAVSLEQTPFDEVRSRLASPEGWEVAAVLRAERIPNPNPACPPGETTLLPESLIPELLEIEHRGACPMLVVAREPMARRWRVEVDGRPAELVTAELGHLAVFVPEGRHRVRFVYDAMSARVWPISVASLLVIAALALIRRR